MGKTKNEGGIIPSRSGSPSNNADNSQVQVVAEIILARDLGIFAPADADYCEQHDWDNPNYVAREMVDIVKGRYAATNDKVVSWKSQSLFPKIQDSYQWLESLGPLGLDQNTVIATQKLLGEAAEQLSQSLGSIAEPDQHRRSEVVDNHDIDNSIRAIQRLASRSAYLLQDTEDLLAITAAAAIANPAVDKGKLFRDLVEYKQLFEQKYGTDRDSYVHPETEEQIFNDIRKIIRENDVPQWIINPDYNSYNGVYEHSEEYLTVLSGRVPDSPQEVGERLQQNIVDYQNNDADKFILNPDGQTFRGNKREYRISKANPIYPNSDLSIKVEEIDDQQGQALIMSSNGCGAKIGVSCSAQPESDVHRVTKAVIYSHGNYPNIPVEVNEAEITTAGGLENWALNFVITNRYEQEIERFNTYRDDDNISASAQAEMLLSMKP